VNVTFHTVAALATAAILSSKRRVRVPVQSPGRDTPFLPAIGFLIGVLLHGLLDYVPHSYPFDSRLDVSLSLTLASLAIAMSKPKNRLLALACYLGCIFPDLIDLGPAAINKLLGWSLTTVKIFPWHWRRYSGSVYDGSRSLESLSFHIVVVALSIGLLCGYRRALFRVGASQDDAS